MEKLIQIQAELKCPKGSYNSFGKYKYRSAEQILEAVKPLLKKYESTLLLTDEMVEVGSKIYLKATAKFINGTESVEVCGFAETSEHKGMSSEQCTGTASSYARKYALNGLFLIDETESDPDAGGEQVKKATQNKTDLKKDTQQWTNAVQKLENGIIDIAKVESAYNLSPEIKNELLKIVKK
jgi:hypothetical protein